MKTIQSAATSSLSRYWTVERMVYGRHNGALGGEFRVNRDQGFLERRSCPFSAALLYQLNSHGIKGIFVKVRYLDSYKAFALSYRYRMYIPVPAPAHTVSGVGSRGGAADICNSTCRCTIGTSYPWTPH